ncbi:MAG: hypothetical protein AAF456_12495, partial [Planctomycetota bacterium]
MSETSENPTELQDPNSEGHSNLRAGNTAIETTIGEEFTGPPMEEVVYSSKSELRSPLTLLSDIARDVYRGRELAWRLFQRNLRGLYRQTLFGFFWAFLPPIANTAMWIFLKNQGAFTMKDTGVHATVYILTGMILWQAFIEAFNMPILAVQKNTNMVRKLRFPREALLLVGFGEVMFNLSIR